MKFNNIISSVVIIGGEFSPSIFKPSEFLDILGEPDINNQVLTPIITLQVFPKSKFKIIVMPEKIEIIHENSEILPEDLKTLSDKLIKKIQKIEIYNCRAIGINVNVEISDEKLGLTGVEFCKKHFLNIPNIEEKLYTDNFIANKGILAYIVNDIKYTIKFEPIFREEKINLSNKINAHQQIKSLEQLIPALENYNHIKEYIIKFHEIFLKDKIC